MTVRQQQEHISGTLYADHVRTTAVKHIQYRDHPPRAWMHTIEILDWMRCTVAQYCTCAIAFIIARISTPFNYVRASSSFTALCVHKNKKWLLINNETFWSTCDWFAYVLRYRTLFKIICLNLLRFTKFYYHFRRHQYSSWCSRSYCGGSNFSCPNSKVERWTRQLRSIFTLKRNIVSPRDAASLIPPFSLRQTQSFSFNAVCCSISQHQVQQAPF